MDFQIRHDGRTFAFHTEVGGQDVTRCCFDECATRRAPRLATTRLVARFLALAPLLLLPACAAIDGDPFCVRYENGQPVAFKFVPSREQVLMFNNAHGTTDTAPPFAGAGLRWNPDNKR